MIIEAKLGDISIQLPDTKIALTTAKQLLELLEKEVNVREQRLERNIGESKKKKIFENTGDLL